MATITGGITGRPAGKIAGIIFGAARSRSGKRVTAREKVDPSNPNTPAQQNQRGLFRECLQRVRKLGSGIYRDDFNRSIGQLPGFQSMMSWLMNAADSEGNILSLPDLNLGTLHVPDTVSFSEAGDNMEITWSEETGSNGTANDEAVLLAIDPNSGLEFDIVAEVRDTATRGDGATGYTVEPANAKYQANELVYVLYFRGKGAAEGTLSRTITHDAA